MFKTLCFSGDIPGAVAGDPGGRLSAVRRTCGGRVLMLL